MALETSIDVVHIVSSLERRGDSSVAVASAQCAESSVKTIILAGPGMATGGTWWGSKSLQGAELILVPDLVAHRSPLRDLLALLRLVRQLKQLKPDVVHTHGAKPGRLGRLAAAAVGIPSVHSFSSREVGRFEPDRGRSGGVLGRARLEVERRLSAKSQRLVVPGRFEQDRILGLGIGEPDRHRLIRSGVALPEPDDVADDRRRFRTELGLVGRAVVGSADCLRADSDPFTVIQGFWLAAIPHSTLLLIGDGPQRARVEAAIEDLAARDRSIDIRLLGYRSDSARLLAACDIAVEASSDPLSDTMLEAAAAGVCVVAPNSGSATDLIEDGKSGRLIDPANQVLLSRVLVEMTNDATLRRSLGGEAQRSCRPFAVDRMRGELLNLWWEAASRGLRSLSQEDEEPPRAVTRPLLAKPAEQSVETTSS